MPGPVGGDMTLRLELFVRDPAKTVDFYCRVLGFGVDHASPGYTSLRNGTTVLGIGPASDLVGHHFRKEDLARDRKGVGAEIVLEVDDVARYHDHVRSSGWPVAEGLRRRSWGPTDFRLVDPDGYYLRITGRS